MRKKIDLARLTKWAGLSLLFGHSPVGLDIPQPSRTPPLNTPYYVFRF